MANTASNLESRGDQLNEAQLRALEGISPDTPENQVLDKAHEIGLINDDTVNSIQVAIPNHVLLFQRALAKERREAGNRTNTDGSIAFKRAFESVYGRFLLEQGPRMVKDAEGNSVIAEGEMEHQDHPFMKMLDKVLKVKVSTEFGLKGRSELQAVVRRLKEVTAARGVGERNEGKIKELTAQKTEASAKIPDLQQKLQTLNATESSLDAIAAPTAKLDGFLARIDRFGGMTADSKEFLDALAQTEVELRSDFGEITDNRDNFFRRIGEMRSNLEQVVSSLSAGYADVFKEEELRELMTDIDGIMQNPDANNVDWQNFIEGKLKKLVKKISTGIFYQNVSDPAYTSPEIKRRIDELVGHFNSLRGHVDDLVIYNQRVEDLKHIAESTEGHTENRDAGIPRKVGRSRKQSLEELKKIIPVVQSLIGNDQLTNWAPECKKECEAFMKEYEAIDGTTDITTFINKTYKPFAAKVRTVIDEAKGKFGAELAVTITQVAGLDSEIKVLESYKSPALMLESILERAFGKQKSPEDMKKLERESHEAGARKTALEETHKYFSGEETKDVQRKYEDLSASGASAKDIRSKEAESKKTEENKAKLGKLKELFAADKTTALNDVFQQLEALLPQYEEALKVKDIDKDIATKVTEAGLLEKEIEAYQKSTKIFEKEKIPKKSGQLKRLRAKIAVLERQKAKRDQFKELAKKFRTELQTYCREYLEAFKLGVTANAAVTKDSVEAMMPNLNDLNVEMGFDFEKLAGYYHLLKGGFTSVFDQVKAKLDNPEFGVQTKQKLDTDKANVDKAKKFHEELKPIVEKILKANKLGVRFVTGKIKNKIGFQIDQVPRETQEQADERANKEFIEGMEAAFKKIKPDHMDFNVGIVTGFYAKYLEEFLGSAGQRTEFLKRIEAGMVKAEKEVKDANKELTLAKEAAEKCKDLTDPQAALKIVGVLVAEQFPKLSMVEQEKLARLVLAQDVAKLQTEEGYDALAKRGSAEDLNLENLHALAVRGKLIGFKYQEGDKEVQPFKGMKPENFKDWASIEKLFNLGQLNHKNGFFLMAALEIFDEEKGGDPKLGVVRSIQSLRVEGKLKFLLAKQLGVHERMHVAGVNKIINDAFKEQMEKVRPLVKAHFSTYDNEWDKGGKGVKSHKIQLLNLKYEELNGKLRKGEIDHAVYEIKLKALVKEATDADVIEEVGFSQNSMLSGFWHSKYSQWVRDRGHDAGKYVGKKALRFGWGALKGSGLGMLNATGWVGLRAGSFATGLAKWPTAVLTGIGSGIFSIFRRGKWMDNVKKDVGKVMGTAGGWQDAMKGRAKGVKILSPIGKQISGEWGKSKYEGTKYADRVKKKEEKRAEKLKVLEEKSKLKAVEIASSPFIDLAQYKAKIEELDKILGTTTKFPAEGNVRVGHEEKPAANSDKKDDHGHQPPAAAAHH